MAHIPRNGKLLSNARKLRKEMTPQERKLWFEFLRTYPKKVYRQRIVGDYIVDFYCAAAHLVIEIDGGQHFTEERAAYDKRRSAFLERSGLVVVRYTNLDVTQNFAGVCSDLDRRRRGA